MISAILFNLIILSMMNNYILKRIINGVINEIQQKVYEKSKGQVILIPLAFDNVKNEKDTIYFRFHYLIMDDKSASIKYKYIKIDKGEINVI